MTYKRIYTLQEVHDLLLDSEGRRTNKKKKNIGGHALRYHSDMRSEVRQRSQNMLQLADSIEKSRSMHPVPYEDLTTYHVPEKDVDSRFTSRGDMIKALLQALNSAEGQTLLQEFDVNKNHKSSLKTIPLPKPIGRVEQFTRATGELKTALKCYSVTLIIIRYEDSIHLQTFYPSEVH